jgi:hypothetical protein
MKRREGLPVNHKKVYKIMKEKDLLVKQKIYKAKRKSTHNKPKATYPKEYWGIDMTKFIIPSIGWAYLIIILD